MQNFNTDTARAAIATAYHNANRAYIARNGENAKIDDKSGLQGDIENGMSWALNPSNISDGALLAIERDLQISWAHVGACIANATNVKVALRIPQFLSFAVSGLPSDLKASAKTALLAFASLMHNAQNRAGIFYGVTGKGSEHTSDNIRGYENASKLLRKVGAVNPSSAKTQISVSLSACGILPALGLVKLVEGKPVLNTDSPACMHFIGLIEGLRDGQLDDIAEALMSKKRGK